MAYPPELDRLLPQARAVIRYLGVQPGRAAPLPAIAEGAGLSERAARKAVRQLVTRYYLGMPATGVYALTEAGQQAARALAASAGTSPEEADTLPAEPPPAPADAGPTAAIPAGGDTPRAAELRQRRRLTVAAPGELVLGMAVVLHVGLSAPDPGQPPLRQPARLVVRLSADGCRVEPRDRPLEVGAGAAGPVRFRVTAQRPGDHALRVEVFQLTGSGDLRRAGGMLCDLCAAELPTPRAAEVATLGAPLTLFAG